MSWIALDIETSGLDPATSRPLLVALALPGHAEVIRVDDWDADRLRRFLTELYSAFADHEFLLHNALFDLCYLARWCGAPIPERIADTMVLEQILAGGLEVDLSLAALARHHLGIELDKGVRDRFREGGEISEVELEYARQDAAVLHRIRQIQERLLEHHGLGRVAELERQVSPVFCRAQAAGIRVDRERLERVTASLQETEEVLAAELVEVLSPHAQWVKLERQRREYEALERWLNDLDRFTRETEQELRERGLPDKELRRALREHVKAWRRDHPRPPKPRPIEPINLGSPQQLKVALETMLGRELPDVRKQTLRSLLGEELPEETREILRKLLVLRKTQKLVDAFANRFPSYLVGDRLYTNLRQIGTATGRPTSERPNLLQVPATPEFRGLFRPSEGCLMVVADYSQMELRILAELSGDPVMQNLFRSGADLHTETAAAIFGVSLDRVTESARKVAKMCNFGICYGMGPRRLLENLRAEGIRVSLKEAERYLAAWRAQFPRASETLERWYEQAVRSGEIRNPNGRIRRFPDSETPDAIGRKGANFVIQSTNADITKRAMVLVDQVVRAHGGRLLLQVYDEIVVEVPEERAREAAQEVQLAMEEAAREVLRAVPVKVDTVISRSWSETDAVPW